MKKSVISAIFLISLLQSINTYAVATGNICTVSLFEKERDFFNNPIPGKHLGTALGLNDSGVSTSYGKLLNVSKTRAIVFNGVIDMAGYFKIAIQEVDQDRDGFLTFENPIYLAEEKTYYTSHPDLPAENKPALIVMDDYLATLSCIVYKKK